MPAPTEGPTGAPAKKEKEHMKVRTGIKTLQRAGLAAAAGVLLVGGLAACGSDEGTETGGSETSEAAEDMTEDGGEGGEDAGDVDDSAVEADLVAAQEAVAAALVDYPDAAQVVLSDSVTEVTFAYGAVQVPFSASDATESITGTVTISDGAYSISATSAASGTEYTIDQDGTIS